MVYDILFLIIGFAVGIRINWLHKKINKLEDRVLGLTGHVNEHMKNRIRHNDY